MLRVFKKKRCLRAFIIVLVVAFTTSGMANFNTGRIIPKGKVLIYRGEQQVGELTSEAPFPEGSLIACDGDCVVRLDDLILAAEDKSMFSVSTKANSRELFLKQGTVYFALSKLPQSLVFMTSQAIATAQRLMLNAAMDGGLLKGYVSVTGNSAEIGIIEGGSMLISTEKGETVIQSGHRIILAQADQPASGLVEIVYVSTGKDYELGTAEIGAKPYIDNDLINITEISPVLENGELVQTAAADAVVDVSVHLVLKAQSPVVLFFCHDKRRDAEPPGWLQSGGWTAVDYASISTTETSASPMVVYRKDLSTGEIAALGGSKVGETGALTNYFVVAQSDPVVAEVLLQSRKSAEITGYPISAGVIAGAAVLDPVTVAGLAKNKRSIIIPERKVLIDRGDQQVDELTTEAPFPEGSLIACDGKCVVLLPDLILVAEDKSMFSVSTKANSRELFLKQGTVFFALAKFVQSLVFMTTRTIATVQQVMLNAATDGGLLKGYISATGNLADIGVIEGGSMLISTEKGETVIQSGHRLFLSGLIEIVSVSTGKDYKIGTAEIGARPYIDDDLINITAISPLMENGELVQTAAEDAVVDVPNHLVLRARFPLVLFFCYDKRGTAGPPGWLLTRDWTPVDHASISTTETAASLMVVYRKELSFGEIATLGGNKEGETGAPTNYFVVAQSDPVVLLPPPVEAGVAAGPILAGVLAGAAILVGATIIDDGGGDDDPASPAAP